MWVSSLPCTEQKSKIQSQHEHGNVDCSKILESGHAYTVSKPINSVSKLNSEMFSHWWLDWLGVNQSMRDVETPDKRCCWKVSCNSVVSIFQALHETVCWNLVLHVSVWLWIDFHTIPPNERRLVLEAAANSIAFRGILGLPFVVVLLFIYILKIFSFLIHYILSTASYLFPYPPSPPATPYFPSSPDPLILCFPLEKSKPPRTINWTQQNKMQQDEFSVLDLCSFASAHSSPIGLSRIDQLQCTYIICVWYGIAIMPWLWGLVIYHLYDKENHIDSNTQNIAFLPYFLICDMRLVIL